MDGVERVLMDIGDENMSKAEFIYFAKKGMEYVNRLPKTARIHKGMVIRLNGDDIMISEHRGKFLKEIVKTNKLELLKAVLLSMAELGVMTVNSELEMEKIDDMQLFNTGVFVKELLPYVEMK